MSQQILATRSSSIDKKLESHLSQNAECIVAGCEMKKALASRAGLCISRSTLSIWTGQCGVALQPLADAMRELIIKQPVLHGDETPVPTLSPVKGSTPQAYFWVWGSTGFYEPDEPKLLVYEFAMSRYGKYASQFLQDFKGTLVCDDLRLQALVDRTIWHHRGRVHGARTAQIL